MRSLLGRGVRSPLPFRPGCDRPREQHNRITETVQGHRNGACTARASALGCQRRRSSRSSRDPLVGLLPLSWLGHGFNTMVKADRIDRLAKGPRQSFVIAT